MMWLYVPKSMLVNDGQYDERSVGGYMGGIGKPGDPINVRDVPWDKWSGPLCTWIPLVLLCAVAVICMSLIIHPQWSKRERLRYPIADFANSLLQQDRDRATGPIFRNKVFWIALVAVLAIRLMNGAHTWYPHTMIEVKLKFIFTGAFKDKFPLFMNYQYANLLTEPEIIPAVIAFSFFLASDISFSIGISHFVSCVAIYLFMRAGVDIAGTYMEGGIKEWCNFGSCLGVAALIVYVGRRYYLQLFKRAMFLGKSREIERYAVWACRIFIVAVAGMIAWLVYFGLDWPLAVMAVLMVLLLFLIVARVNAECGLFFYKPPWMIPGILVGLIGMQTLGPQMLAIVAMFAIMLTADTFECLIPYVTNGLKINETVGVRPGKTGWMAAGAFALGLAVVIPVALWADYNFGIGNHGWVKWASKQTFDTVTRTVKTLTTAGSLDQVLDYTWWERIRNIRPDLTCLYAIGVGFLLVVIVGKLRLRFPWWFVHPVIFLGFGARIIGKFGFSFLLGCLIKVVLTRVGGAAEVPPGPPADGRGHCGRSFRGVDLHGDQLGLLPRQRYPRGGVQGVVAADPNRSNDPGVAISDISRGS